MGSVRYSTNHLSNILKCNIQAQKLQRLGYTTLRNVRLLGVLPNSTQTGALITNRTEKYVSPGAPRIQRLTFTTLSGTILYTFTVFCHTWLKTATRFLCIIRRCLFFQVVNWTTLHLDPKDFKTSSTVSWRSLDLFKSDTIGSYQESIMADYQIVVLHGEYTEDVIFVRDKCQ